VAQSPPATVMAIVAAVAALFIMIWFTVVRIKTYIQSAATAAIARTSITMAGNRHRPN
jgi:hypothetical protein